MPVNKYKLIVEAINLMDEKGRSNPEDNSKLLWDHDWATLRSILMTLLMNP
jgi:hypothetical protein